MPELFSGDFRSGNRSPSRRQGREKGETVDLARATGDDAGREEKCFCQECGREFLWIRPKRQRGRKPLTCSDRCKRDRQNRKARSPERREKNRASARKRLKPAEKWAVRDNFKRDKHGTVIEKICTICEQWKPAAEFSKRRDTASGIVSFCKTCEKLRSKEYRKRHYTKRKTKPKKWPDQQYFCQCGICQTSFLSKKRDAYLCSQKCKREWARIKGRLKQLERHSEEKGFDAFFEWRCRECKQVKPWKEFGLESPWYIAGRVPLCKPCKKKNALLSARKQRSNPKHKVRKRLSNRFRECMNSAKKGGTCYLKDFIGCSTHHLREHLEAQFTRGMNWANYGTHWHVDHIVPVSAHDHEDEAQVRACWHFSNLRPLRAEENIAKSDSIIDCQPELTIQIINNQ